MNNQRTRPEKILLRRLLGYIPTMRFRVVLAVFAVVAAACGGSADPSASPAPAPTTQASEAPTPTTGDTAQTTGAPGTDAPTTDAPISERPPTEGPAAPAINTVLSDGTAFSLADEANPVYLIFWAEW